MKDVEKFNSENTKAQVDQILEAVVSLGKLNFDQKAPVLGKSEQLDALAEGINMLGEELQAKIILINEKETLLREIHHRVKNNLQIVSSILNLQSKVIQDPKIANKIEDCRERISSMALVHEQLYQSDDLSQLEVNSYFAALCKRLEHIHATSNITLQFRSADKSHFLSVDQMIPLGLLANELIINSFKHAFRPNQGGVISIGLNADKDHFSFELTDNGIGFKDPKNFYNSTSLGLQLVHSLIDQLDAELEFTPQPYCVIVRMRN